MKDTIDLVYLDLGQKLVLQSLIAEARGSNLDDIKERSLIKLGVTKHKNESFGDAWLRHISEINGFQFTKPVHQEIAGAIGDNPKVLQFYFWLI